MAENQKRRALYLRWRPQTFAEVVGQEHVTRTLRNAVRSGKLAHAYLLCGPRGTGKTSLARILYRAANCAQPLDGEPCGRCPTCTAAAAGRALDLVEVDAASNRGIDDIRQLRDRVGYAPSEGRFRLYIIDEAHELTAPAWDAFLKTLEEPPPHTIFVLATTEAHKVPPTIVSRCQRFDLRRIDLAAIRTHLAQVAEREGMQAEPAVLDCLARMARGGLRDALSLLDQLHAYAGQRLDLAAARAMLGLASTDAVRAFVEALEAGDAATALQGLAGVMEDGVDLRQFVGEVVTYLRGLMLARTGAAAALRGDFSTEDLDWLQAHARRWAPERLLALTRSLAEGTARLRDTLHLELHLELAVLESCAGERGSWREGESEREGAREASVAPSLSLSPSLQLPPSLPRSVSPSPSPEPLTLSLERVRALWPQVMDQLRSRSGVVAAMLEAAQLASLNADELRLAFGYAFHSRQVSDSKNRRLVEDALAEVVGQPLRVACTHQPLEAPPIEAEDFVAELQRLVAEDPVVRRAVDLWGRNLAIVE
ncbi:MAG: DNA polymerase III subunit gamma/tau [Chloroflexi bacterium]|nr:DNA polymerase III subunit gamma/tau [Chloroflexota bacterium]